MSYLFFDVETDGLPKDFNDGANEVDNWPRLVQLAWMHYDDYGNKLAEHNYIIKPDGFIIDEESIKIHKITQERAEKEGVSLRYALQLFATTLNHTDRLIAHNIDFDRSVVGAELIRLGADGVFKKLNKTISICTMKSTVQFCKLPGQYGYKWPKLSELYEKINGGEYLDDNLHNALVDVNVMADCFFKLKERKII